MQLGEINYFAQCGVTSSQSYKKGFSAALLLHHRVPRDAFNPDTGIRSIKHTIGYSYPFYTARHFAADDHSTVTGKHDTIGDCDVFACFPIFTPVGITSGLDGNTIVSNTDKTVGDTYIPAGTRIDTVRIRPFRIA